MTAALPSAADALMPPRPLLDIRVDGDPAPQGSKRYLGKGVMVESSNRVKTWRHDIMAAVVDATGAFEATDGPVAAELTFLIARPRSHMRTGRNAHLIRDSAPARPQGKPDLDKLARAVLDAIGSSGRIWRDDSQVVILRAVKTYAHPGEPAGVYITVRSIIP